MLRAFSAVIIAFAVSGMHFSGMAAAKYVINDHSNHHTNHRASRSKHTISSSNVMTGALVRSAILLGGIFVLSIADLRAWFYIQSKTLRRIEPIINQIEKSPIHAANNSNLLSKYRIIVNKNSSMHSKVSEQEASRVSKVDYFELPRRM
jgi:hypothetical protein